MFKNNSYRRAIVLLLGILIALLSFPAYTQKDQESIEELKPVIDAYKLILEEYYQPETLDKKKLIRSAIEGMLDQLPDDYNAVYSKEEYEKYRKRQEGNYVGIGMEVGESGKQTKIISVFPDTPASRSGLMSGDVILSINGESTADMELQEVFDALDGEEGTEVQIRVRHENGLEEEISLTISKIKISPVELELLETGEIALIDINLFNRETAGELEKIINQLDTKKIEGYVVDLRNNSGGWLNTAVRVASQFVDSGLITKTVGRNGEREYYSRGNSNPNLPLVILINNGTASASELVAGAIRDQGMGILVGRTSFGKGLVQTTHTVGGGIRVKLSTAEYLTPDGNKLHEKGLTPDIATKDLGEDLIRAIEWIKDHQGELMPLR